LNPAIDCQGAFQDTQVKQVLHYLQSRRNRPLVSAAEAYCGSWGKALYTAGIDPNLYFVHHRWRKAA
jgi:hypothetical protein